MADKYTEKTLKDKVAVVTGAGGGIGRAICAVLARDGAKIAAVDIDEESMKQTVIDCVSVSNREDHYWFVADVSQAEEVSRLAERILSAFGTAPCVLVNCAAILRAHKILEIPEDEFDLVLQVNLKSVYLMTKYFGNLMVEHKLKGASIVNISSITAKAGNNHGRGHYAAAKAGMIGFTKCTTKELSPSGIRCNVILPGVIDTPLCKDTPQERMEAYKAIIPIGRVGQPEEVAEACLFLASERSSYITGACLEVTGGHQM